MPDERKRVAGFYSQAKALLKNPKKLFSLLNRANTKISKSNAIQSVQHDVTTLIRLLRAYGSGKYKNIPWGSLVKITASLIYFVWIIDAVPDFLLGVGLLDDLSVFLWTLKSVRKDLDHFKAWEASSSPNVID